MAYFDEKLPIFTIQLLHGLQSSVAADTEDLDMNLQVMFDQVQRKESASAQSLEPVIPANSQW